MEERRGWREAFSTAYNNLIGINNEGNLRFIRWGFFLLFIAGIVWAGFHYMQMRNLVESLGQNVDITPTPLPNDKARLDGVVSQVETTKRIRDQSPQIAEDMQVYLTKYPFADPTLQPPPVVVVSEDIDIIPVFVEDVGPEPKPDDFPEGILLKAIILGSPPIALMDIPGVGNGLLVNPGDTFQQKKGRIVSITPEKVVLNWGGKNWDIRPDGF